MPDGLSQPLPPNASACTLHFQPKQREAFWSKATELLYGGAAFGAKSHGLRLMAINWAVEIPGLQIYLFRRVEDELIKNHIEGPQGFREMLAPWVRAGLVSIVEREIRFWTGSKIYLCHCKDEKHRYRYHGDEMHVLLIDEVTTFSELIYRYLRFRVRMVGIDLPEHYREGHKGLDGTINSHNLFPRIVCATNPGNIGHHWVKRTWALDSAGLLLPMRMPEIEGGLVRQYIHARYTDNPIGMGDDPTYLARMAGLGDTALVKAMLDGDWNLLAGGFFPEFMLARHVLKAQTLPKDIFPRLVRAHDWGSARPFSSGWYGICIEDWKAEGTLGNQILVPRGAIVRFREWYGKKEGVDNHGIKLTADKWALGILQRTRQDEQVLYDVIDPACFAEDGGPSIAELGGKAKDEHGRKILFRKGDNKRQPGWEQVRGRLVGDEIGNPLLFLMDNQPDAIRLLQSVQHDELKFEDLDTDQEDHAVDEIRYMCMSRPRPITKPAQRVIPGPKPGTFEWLIQQDTLHRSAALQHDRVRLPS